MIDAILNFFVLLTPIFIIYWIVSMIFISIGQFGNGGTSFLSFMRLWIKPLFWMNFSYFVAAEIIFSAIYWGSYAFSKIASLAYIGFIGRPLELLFNFLFRLIPTSAGGDGALESYLFISALLFIVVMIPYIIVHLRLTSYFKKLIFNTVTNEFEIPEAKFLTQKPGKILPSSLVNYLVSQNSTAKKWIVKTFEEQSSSFEGDPKKFSLATINADHMQLKYNNQNFEYWESKIEIEMKTPKRDSDNKLSYNSDKHTCLDGLIIKANDIFTHDVETMLYEIETDIEFSSHRAEHKQGFWITLIEIFGKGGGKHLDESNTSLEDFPESLFSINLNDSLNIKYVGTEGKSLFLFIETRLDGTMFDFNQNLAVSESVELFRQDLNFVIKHCQLAEEVTQAIQALESESLQSVA